MDWQNLHHFLIRPAVLREKLFLLVKNRKNLSADNMLEVLTHSDVCAAAVLSPPYLHRDPVIKKLVMAISLDPNLGERERVAIRHSFQYGFLTPKDWLDGFRISSYRHHKLADLEFIVSCGVPIKEIRKEILSISVREGDTRLLGQLIDNCTDEEIKAIIEYEKSVNSINMHSFVRVDKSQIFSYMQTVLEKRTLVSTVGNAKIPDKVLKI